MGINTAWLIGLGAAALLGVIVGATWTANAQAMEREPASAIATLR